MWEIVETKIYANSAQRTVCHRGNYPHWMVSVGLPYPREKVAPLVPEVELFERRIEGDSWLLVNRIPVQAMLLCFPLVLMSYKVSGQAGPQLADLPEGAFEDGSVG